MSSKNKNRKCRSGIVYSTDNDFVYQYEGEEEKNTPAPSEQNLVVSLDRRNRKGKSVTLIEGFRGTGKDMKILGKELKTLCGAGGSAKEGKILIQGDFRKRIVEFLNHQGFQVKE